MAHVLHAYQVQVRRKWETKQHELLGNFDSAGADLLDELAQFFTDPKARDWVDERLNAAARVAAVYLPDENAPDVIAATIKSGEMGIASELVVASEKQLGEDVVFLRGREHAELIPVLVLAKLPGTRTRGFLISHSPGGRGVKTKFWDAFREWFKQRHPDYVIDMDPTTPETFYRRVIAEQELRRVTLIRAVRPQDMADDDRRWFEEETLGRIETTIKPVGRKAVLRKQDVLQALDDDDTLKSLLIFKNEIYDEIRTTFTDGSGRERSVLLQQSGRAPRAGLDVSEQLDVDEHGHPTYETLRRAALDYIEELAGE